MSHPFEQTPLWQRTLSQRTDDPHSAAREQLRLAYLQLRSTVEPLAAEISRHLPLFTDHSNAHADALWDTASLIAGDAFPINPAEAFVLGSSFLLHDLGMGLASYRDGLTELERDPRFADLHASAQAVLSRGEQSADPGYVDRAAYEQAIVALLRLRHAVQAERLITTVFRTSDGEPFYLLADPDLRLSFGALIGRISRSHWWDVPELRNLEPPQGSCVNHPASWEVDPLKLACVLRLADISQVDNRRAPTYLHTFRQPTGTARDHWYFQERLSRPRVAADRLVYTSTRSFSRNEASAWWLAYDAIKAIDSELRRVDALCVDLGRPRFAIRSVAGADSPERLAAYVTTDGWEPLDARLRVSQATDLIANLGGVDLYGLKPDVALRELIANAADATRARSVHEGSQAGAVTVRLTERNGSWWLEVEDHGIGMAPEAMVSALTDFGHSRWQSAAMLDDFPGLLAKGFHPTGRFGIGFFAVFMVADEVQVHSLAYDEAPRSTHVLEFHQGVFARPLLRAAEVAEQLRVCGTVVKARLRHDPLSMEGLFKTTNRQLTRTQLLHSRLTRMCALAEVDIRVQGPDDERPVTIVRAHDWVSITPAELFRRIYRKDEASHLDGLIYDGYQRVFTDRATELLGNDGSTLGRAMVASGWEPVYPDLFWRRLPEAPIYVGGLESGQIFWCMGAFVGYPLTADRLRAFPLADLEQLQAWLDAQADAIAHSDTTGHERMYLGDLIRGFGAIAAQLPCVDTFEGSLTAAELREHVVGLAEVFLVSPDNLIWHQTNHGRRLYYTVEGDRVDLPASYLLVDMNPGWYVPEEVSPRPKDEHFADAAGSFTAWDPRTW